MGIPKIIRKLPKTEVKEVDNTEVGKFGKQKVNIVDFEIEKRLKMGETQADIQKALKNQGVNIANDDLKQRIAVARRRDSAMNADPSMKRMEANWIIEKGVKTGKDWEDIAAELRDAGFNGDKLVKVAKDKQTASAYGAYGLGLFGAGAASGTAEGQTPTIKMPQPLQSDRERAADAPITDEERKKWAAEDAALAKSLADMRARAKMAEAEAKKRNQDLEDFMKRIPPNFPLNGMKQVHGVDEDAAAAERAARQQQMMAPPDLPPEEPGTISTIADLTKPPNE